MSMYAQFYAHMPWKELPVFALLLFLTVFVGVVLRVVIFTRPSELETLARLPLEGDPLPRGSSDHSQGAPRAVQERTQLP